ncbi:MAG: DUF547 domain-containing protein [Vicinamibacteria bacterium]
MLNLTTILPVLAFALGPAPSPARFDHSAFDTLLRRHVVAGMVDYDAFASSREFDVYLEKLKAFDPAVLSRDEQLAFWINTYNAYTVRLITKHGERTSIRNINKAFGVFKGSGPWAERLVVVSGKTYDLETVEQQIIRPTFKEPRIHFALVCAAMGCPPLRSEAYTGADLERQLEDQTRTFLRASPTKNRVDVATRTVWVSEIFQFNDYEKDFGGSKPALMRFIARSYTAGPERALLEAGDATLRYTDYDWTLNSQEQARKLTGSPKY